ncbi:hypothetical protein ACFY12_33130 [Streptomyces sp. NPDC001339]|uniref:hypothetical protein n=1 Tax=Streptomyces sp. NPDC001339 TaxID=3364563 RepID=UPI003686C2F2
MGPGAGHASAGPRLRPGRTGHRRHQGKSRLADNLAALDVELEADALARLDATSQVPLGYPHDIAREPGVTQIAYGDRWADVEDRRSTYRRTVHDVR